VKNNSSDTLFAPMVVQLKTAVDSAALLSLSADVTAAVRVKKQ